MCEIMEALASDFLDDGVMAILECDDKTEQIEPTETMPENETMNNIRKKFFVSTDAKDLTLLCLDRREVNREVPNATEKSILSAVFFPTEFTKKKPESQDAKPEQTSQKKKELSKPVKMSDVRGKTWLSLLYTWSKQDRKSHCAKETPFLYYQTLLFVDGVYAMTVNIHLYAGPNLSAKAEDFLEAHKSKVTFFDEELSGKTFDQFSHVDEMKSTTTTTNKSKRRALATTTTGLTGPRVSVQPFEQQNSQAQRRREVSRPELNSWTPTEDERRVEISESTMTPPANFPQEFVAFSFKEQLILLPCYPGMNLPAETTSYFKFKVPRFQTSKAKMAWMLDDEFELNPLAVAAGGPLVFPKWCRGGWLIVFNRTCGQLLQLPLDSSSVQLPPDMAFACTGILFHGGGTGCFTFEVQPSEPPVPTQIAVPNSQASSSNSGHSGSFTSLMNSASSNATTSGNYQQLLGSFNWLNSAQGLTLDQRIEQSVRNYVEGINHYLANLDDVHSTGYTLQDMIDAFAEDDEESDGLQDQSEACTPTASPESHSHSSSPPSPEREQQLCTSPTHNVPTPKLEDDNAVASLIQYSSYAALKHNETKQSLLRQWINFLHSSKEIEMVVQKFFGKNVLPFWLSMSECFRIDPNLRDSVLSAVCLPSDTKQAKSKISNIGRGWLVDLFDWGSTTKGQYSSPEEPLYYYQTLLFVDGKYVMTVNIHLYSDYGTLTKVEEYLEKFKSLEEVVFIDKNAVGKTFDEYLDIEEMKEQQAKKEKPILRLPLLTAFRFLKTLPSSSAGDGAQNSRGQDVGSTRLASSALGISSSSEEESITSTQTHDDLPPAKRQKTYHKQFLNEDISQATPAIPNNYSFLGAAIEEMRRAMGSASASHEQEANRN